MSDFDHISIGCRVCTTLGESNVVGIDYCVPGEKYGQSVNRAPMSSRDNLVLDLANGHWVYGSQVNSWQSEADLEIYNNQSATTFLD